MEKGTIRNLSGYNSGGMIDDGSGALIKFSSSDIVARGRTRLEIGDQVWFERIGYEADIKAINIRRC